MHVRVDEGKSVNQGSLRPHVIKFGGTSVTGGDRIDTIADVVSDRLEMSRPVLVVSAFANVSTLLERAAFAARNAEPLDALAELHTIHQDAVVSMTDSAAELREAVDDLLSECCSQLRRIVSPGECTPQELDEILAFGERLSSIIITRGLVDRGITAHAIDAADVVVTDMRFGDARADLEATRRRIDVVIPPLSTDQGPPSVPIVTGFIGATPAGLRTTLGREGSDYSAAVLAWGLRAEAVEIWTDVDGIMTADPRVVTDARPLRNLTYDELLELTSWGAKVVHPKTVRPLCDLGIRLTVRNTLSPNDRGTRVGPAGQQAERHGPLGVTRIDSSALLSVAVQSGTSGFGDEQSEALARIRRLDRPCAVVTAVGDRLLPGTSGVLDRLPEVLASEGVTVHAVVEGASGRSLSYLVRPADGDIAVRAVHEALFGRPGELPGSETTAVDHREPDAVHA